MTIELALFCAWAEALLGVEICVMVFFAAGQIGLVGCGFLGYILLLCLK